MNLDDFEYECRMLQRESEEVLQDKRQDYSPQEDVLENFKGDGEFLGLDPKLICLVHITKQLRAIRNYAQGHKLVAEQALPRIRDAYNYLKLLNALIVEEEENESSSHRASETPKGGEGTRVPPSASAVAEPEQGVPSLLSKPSRAKTHLGVGQRSFRG